MKLHIRIRQARKDAGLSQAALAEMTGVQRSAVAQWERETGSKPASDRLSKIAVATGVSHEWLTTGRGPRRLSEEGHDDASSGLMLSQFAQCELEERMLLAFRELKSKDQMAHVDFLESLTGRRQAKERGENWG